LDKAKERLFAAFEGEVADVDETKVEMRRVYEESGYLVDPHTAVASFVARKLGYPKNNIPCVIAATATPYKFPETSFDVFGKDVLTDPPENFKDLEKLPIAQKEICEVSDMSSVTRRFFHG
jgi:threonine synthase